ncbi:methyl-accepting chemotaxis protein [Crocosphaera sp.]|uniref:methyl-accepting chemotaxis protein n=1 Tax=Crocosphaera sp. TaxID=2729996 RepID=UPI002612E0ED|nr:methyl-accepting chemotaxis protein [Crocosphaera sp.]MDJ0580779.1 methyl-accepting chemotaxis protein [Crocosphaera sp.]
MTQSSIKTTPEAIISQPSPNSKAETLSGWQRSMKIPFMQRLQFRVPLFVLLGVIPPMLIGINYASSRASKIIETNAQEILANQTQALTENVARWKTMNVLALQNLSRLPSMVSLEAKQQKPLLEEFVKSYDHLYLASTIGLDGMNIARNDNKPLKDYSSRNYFKGAKAGNDITWQSLISKTNQQPATCFSTPIRQQEVVAGVLQACSNLDTIAQQVGAVKIGETGYAMVVDEAGQLVAHPNSTLVTGDKLTDFRDYPPVKALLGGRKGHLDFTDGQGISWIAYSASLENGWGVFVVQQQGEAFLQKRQFEQIVWTIALTVVGLVGLIVFVVTNRMVKPIIRLTKASGALSSGLLNQKININRNDEIGVLADSFNTMAQQLQVSIASLEQEADQKRQQKEKLENEIAQLLGDVGGAMDGDLTVRANLTSMEMSTVADLFNAIIHNLKDIAMEVKTSTTHVSSSLGDNKQSIQGLAQQAIEEAEATRQTLGSVEAMSQSIEAVANNANEAATLVDDTYTVTQEGSKAMDKTVDSIFQLRTTVGETGKKMKRLGESSQKISQVVSLIEEIALKTNLLAINASVEARRAGKQGEGFMIVAEQVGALAEQSAAATKEITQIVEAIQGETQEVTQAMELGTSQVVDSTRLVEATKKRLETVLARSQTINELMHSISQATVSQTETSRVVTELMQQIAQQSQQRSTASQTVAQSMEETAQVAQKLEATVEQFKIS